MNVFGPEQAGGHIIELHRTHPGHLSGKFDAAPSERTEDFAGMLFESLGEVNSRQHQHADLSVQAIVDPDSVNPHDVTIAGAKAEMSLNITKNVVDRVIRAYRDITTLR